jgi:hypothetical protein
MKRTSIRFFHLKSGVVFDQQRRQYPAMYPLADNQSNHFLSGPYFFYDTDKAILLNNHTKAKIKISNEIEQIKVQRAKHDS